jgi:oligopeptide transport system substrate-binding protein
MASSRWRLLLGLLSIFAVLAFAAACGDDDDDDDGDGGDGGDANVGGELTIQYLEHASFDPHFSSFAQDIGVQGMVFRGLYFLGKDNNPVPLMAAEMPEISEDGLTYTINIKDDLLWSDGEPLKAKDFVAGFIRTCNPDNAGEYYYLIANIAGCSDYYAATEASDSEKEELREGVAVKELSETSIEIKIVEPQASFTSILSLWMTWPVPTHIVANPGDPWPDPADLVFNGPFKVESYTAADSMVLVRNDNYAGPHKAYLDKLTLRYIDQADVANNAYRNNELSVTLADVANFTVVKDEFGDEVTTGPAARITSLQMQMENEVLENADFRLALSRAIDRETITNTVLQGAFVPSTTWIPVDVMQTDADNFEIYNDQIGYDPDAAKELLEKAGFPNGEGVPTLNYLIRDSPSNKAVAEFLKQQFKEILNIDIEIEIVDSPTRSKRFTEEQFELFPGGWAQDYPDPENWIIGLFDTDGGLNHYNCTDTEIDGLIADAKFNTNNEERFEQYRQINELISTRICGVAPMYFETAQYIVKPNVKGPKEFNTSQNRVLAGDWAVEEWSLE